MLSSVSYVCLGACSGMWVIRRGIYLGVLVLSFISVLLFQFGSFLFAFDLLGCVCVCSFCFYFPDVFSSSMRFPRDPVLYNLLQVLFRKLRWLAEHPVLPPSIFLPTSDGVLGHENMAYQFFPLPRFTLLFICVI